MVRVGIDARAIMTVHLTGIERMLLRLLEHWPPGDPTLFAYVNRNGSRRFSSVKTIVVKPRQDAVWFHLSLPWRLRRDRVDVFVSPVTQFPALLPASLVKVVIVYDLAYIHFPHLYDRKELALLHGRVARSITSSDGIITISQSTKRDLEKTYGIDPESIAVCYPAADPGRAKEELPPDVKRLQPYVLTVGTAYGRKNLSLIPAVLTLLRDQYHLRPNIVMTGKQGFGEARVLEAADRAGVRQQITHLGYVSDVMTKSLMAYAAALFFPSLYEGFGIPVLEAFHQRCPVVSSQASSLPEVGGEAALYFDPQNPESAAKALADILTQPSLREQLVRRGIEQSQRFSWDRTAQCIKDALVRFYNRAHEHRT